MHCTSAMMFEEHDLEVPAGPSPRLELDYAPRAVPIARFIPTRDVVDPATIAVDCPYCEAPLDRYRHACANCGFAGKREAIPTQRISSSPSSPSSSSSSPAVSTRTERGVDAIRTVPFEVWKRVPVYAFLAMLFGNGCRCGGLSTSVNAALGILLVIGLVGVAVSFQRNP
jgi:hypothetical protein